MMRIGLIIVVFCFGYLGVAFAQSESFTINTTIINSDTDAPASPGNVAAVADTQTQALVTWDAATDNVAVTGYQVWRDNVQIATTTLLSYVDNPVIASTTYLYYITAFDAVGNVSASSSVVSLTMPSDIVSTPSVTSSSAGSGRLQSREYAITNLEISPALNSIRITFTTDTFVRTQVQYAVEGSEAPFTIIANQARRSHDIIVTGLTPGTLYDVDIFLTRTEFEAVPNETLQARTLAPADTTPPPNVRAFVARPTDNGVALSWQNPTVVDFDRVRVVRSEAFYPIDMADGWVVYEGDRATFLDTQATAARPTYYTIFAIDTAGNVSSGAVALAYIPPVGTPPPSPVDTVIPPPDWSLQLDITQSSGRAILQASSTFVLPYAEPFTLSIPAATLPSNLKTIVATLVSPTDELAVFRFLLRINPERTAYEATIDVLLEPGTYPLTIDWYDFKTQQAYQWQGAVVAVGMSESAPSQNPWWPLWPVIVVCSLGLYYLYRRQT